MKRLNIYSKKSTSVFTDVSSISLFFTASDVFSVQSPTWSPDVHIHAVILNLALRGCGSDGGDAQVGSVQVLLCPLAVVRLVVRLQDSLIIVLLGRGRGQCEVTWMNQGQIRI